MDELFDGDSNTYKIVTAKEPYVQVQLNTFTKIDQLDITLKLGKYKKNIITIYISDYHINSFRVNEFTFFGRK